MKATFLRFTFLHFAACFGIALTSVAAAEAPQLSTRGVMLDRIAAVVNDGVVLTSQLDRETQGVIQRLRAQNTQIPPMSVLRKQVLERLVVREIQLQRANRAGIRVSDEMLNSALTDVARRNNISFSDLPNVLEQQGVDYRAYREDLRRTLSLQILQQREVIAKINVAPREIEQFLARQKGAADRNTEYKLSHILISLPVAAPPEQLRVRETRAREVYEKAKGGEDFAQLAVQYSESSTNVEGGDLGWRRGPQVPSIVAEYIGKLKAGEITEPIRTPTGFHIFRLDGMRNADGSNQQAIVAQVHARHILMRTNEVEDDNTVAQKLSAIRDRVLNNKEDFAAIAAVTSADSGSATDGGDLGWAGPGTFAPEFEKQLDGLKDNEISKPFKTQFGWHIVQLLGRRMHDTTDDRLQNQAFVTLREAKAEEETELWLQRLRDEAFVDYRI